MCFIVYIFQFKISIFLWTQNRDYSIVNLIYLSLSLQNYENVANFVTSLLLPTLWITLKQTFQYKSEGFCSYCLVTSSICLFLWPTPSPSPDPPSPVASLLRSCLSNWFFTQQHKGSSETQWDYVFPSCVLPQNFQWHPNALKVNSKIFKSHISFYCNTTNYH